MVEDDDDIRDLLGSILERDGYAVEVVNSSRLAVARLNEKKYDLVLVERLLPEMCGLDLIKFMRSSGSRLAETPALVISTQCEPKEMIAALEAGASDFLPKPFERLCLLGRVRSLLKHLTNEEIAESQKIGKLTMGPLVINTNTQDVFLGSSRIELTPSEFKLLHALSLHRGMVLTRTRLMELVQGHGIAVIDRAIDTHVFGLRKKLGVVAEMIETVRGVGYRILETTSATEE